MNYGNYARIIKYDLNSNISVIVGVKKISQICFLDGSYRNISGRIWIEHNINRGNIADDMFFPRRAQTNDDPIATFIFKLRYKPGELTYRLMITCDALATSYLTCHRYFSEDDDSIDYISFYSCYRDYERFVMKVLPLVDCIINAAN